MDAERQLFRRFPGLRPAVPWLPLGTFPSPVERMARLGARLGCDRLFVKRDDLAGEPYGGNKVRKLEFTLADARRRGADRIVTVGAVGSNHLLATTVYAPHIGASAVGIVVPQPVQQYVRTNVLSDLALGCQIRPAPSLPCAAAELVATMARERLGGRRRSYFLWAGGSSALGVLGYVEAGLEIAAQVQGGLLPEPEWAFVPVGSGGTLAGLVLGLRLAGLRTRPIGVCVYARPATSAWTVALLANLAARYLRRCDRAVPRMRVRPAEIELLGGYLGPGYAHYTRRGVQAVELARDLECLALEGTYSGKCLAAFIDFVSAPERRGAAALFVNTYNSRPLAPLLAGAPRPEALPAPLRRYFEEPIAAVRE
ncbi:MAG: pyridoxal-phosphate dependent enzyme [Deltaproteobacteria bacterium]|nr:pyridoxal-phosphate dependent enzyme [Deltaproteobacteria bacterium]